MSSSSRSAAARPRSLRGCIAVVRGGVTTPPSSTPSNPTTATSSGIRWPRKHTTPHSPLPRACFDTLPHGGLVGVVELGREHAVQSTHTGHTTSSDSGAKPAEDRFPGSEPSPGPHRSIDRWRLAIGSRRQLPTIPGDFELGGQDRGSTKPFASRVRLPPADAHANPPGADRALPALVDKAHLSVSQ